MAAAGIEERVVRRRAAATAAAGLALAVVAACGGGSGATAPPATTPDLTSSTAAERAPFPSQPDDVAWPTEAWTEGPWPEGADRVAVDQATDTALADGATERVRAIVIVHRGQIVYERYSPNPEDGPDVVMPSYSIAKSVTSAAIGILVRQGLLDVDEPAPVPEWHTDPDDPRGDITVLHMLHMATGMPWRDDYTRPGTEMYALVRRDDAGAYAAAQESTAHPGTRFDYNSGTSTLLARIVGDAVGDSADDTRRFLDEELFDKLGIDVRTDFDEAGTWLGAYSADMTARDYAKLGLLYGRGGVWDGERILDEAWVERTRTPSPANPDYGLQWWLDTERPGVLYAIGIRGQVITVDPSHDLVVVQLSTTGGPIPLEQTEAILNAFTFVEP